MARLVISLRVFIHSSMRSLSKTLLAKGAKKIMPARDLFMSHLKVVKNSLKAGVEILRNVESVSGKIEFDLPEFASDIDFEVCRNNDCSILWIREAR